ncbi:hypothetical protein [Roseitalea porphyridii]|nr:hypothetical protein [Roseitalea porphyridii]
MAFSMENGQAGIDHGSTADRKQVVSPRPPNGQLREATLRAVLR